MFVAETERLVLKRFSLDDVDGFFDLNNDPAVLKYTGDIPFMNRDEVANFIETYEQYEKYGFGRWSVYLKESDSFMGFSGLRKSPETGEIDIGFRFMRKYWNQGYATESAEIVLNLAFCMFNVTTVVARAMKDNSASHALIRRLGMNYHSTFISDGAEWSKYELLKSGWTERAETKLRQNSGESVKLSK